MSPPLPMNVADGDVIDKLPRIVYPPNAIPIDIPTDLVIPKDTTKPNNDKVIVYTATHQPVNLYRPANPSLPSNDYERYGGTYVTTNNIAQNPNYWLHCSKVVSRVFGLDYPEYVTKIQVSKKLLLPDPSIVNTSAKHTNVYWIPPINDAIIITKYFVQESDMDGIFSFIIIP